MVSQKTKVVNSQGFHMRPASVFVAEMAKFENNIFLVAGDKEVNAKSLMNIIAAALKCGTELEVRADGPDEEAAMAKAVEMIDNGLGEE